MFQLAGGVILGVALWLRHDPKISNLLELEYDGTHAPSTFYISMYSSVSVTCLQFTPSPSEGEPQALTNGQLSSLIKNTVLVFVVFALRPSGRLLSLLVKCFI